MSRKYKIAITITIVLLAFSVGFTVINHLMHSAYDPKTANRFADVDSSVGVTTLPKDYLVDDSFESHLPLVIIDIGEQTIPKAFKYNFDEEIWDKIEGVDPFIYGTISIINGRKVNKLSDEPETVSRMQIRRRGNMSLDFEKGQYKIELLDEMNEKNKVDILGMGADNDWILTISMIDKSLVRNYLAYSIAKELDESTPDAQYCEVVIKNGDKYSYEGLYFICESIKQSPSRIDITEYNSKSAVTSFLLRRDRFDPDALLLNNYATVNSLTYGYIEVKYPSADKISDESLKYIENRISEFEKCLYSEDETEFENYQKYIDIDSFVDYFIINEYFGNYDAGNNSTYFYADKNGIIHMGPVWDFDGAYDNYTNGLASVNEMIFDDQPWFNRLILSETFVKRLNERYEELREGILSDKSISDRIDEITEYLGNAQVRDWERWGAEYDSRRLGVFEDSDGIPIDRNTETYDAEISQIKDYLSLHAEGMNSEIGMKYNKIDAIHFTDAYAPWLIIFIVVFICSVVIARRGMR